MKHSPKNWAIIGSLQFGIIIGGFNLPNNIVNGATWYAPLIDFGRIALLFGFPASNIVLSTKLLVVGKRKKAYLRQFIDSSSHFRYDSLDPIHFINLTPAQIDLIENNFKYHSRDDLLIDSDFSFKSLERYLQKTNENA